MKFLKEHSIFICIFLFCAFLRFIPLFEYQMTYDELSGMERTQFDSFSEVIDKGIKIDAHPAFVQLVIFYLSKVFGYVNWIFKLPFLLFSLGAVIYAYCLGLRNFSKQVGLFLAVIFSFSLVFIFYAPIARMYISGIFFSIALLYYFFEIIFLKNTKGSNYFFFAFFALLCAVNQHLNSLYALTLCASGFLFLDKTNWKRYTLTCLLIIIAYLPNMPITLYQLGVGGIGRDQGGWLDKPEWYDVFGFLKMLVGTGKTWILILGFILIAFFTNKKLEFSKKQLLLVVLFFINYLIVYFYSVYRASVFQYSVMLFSGVGMLVFICSFLNFKNKNLFYIGLVSLFSFLIYKSYFKKDYFKQSVKTVFEYQFEKTVFYKNLYGDTNVYPVFIDADAIMKKIYFAKYQPFNCTVSNDSVIFNMHAFSRFIASLPNDYLVLTSATPAYQSVAKYYFPYLLENTQTQAINFKLYSKRKTDSEKQVADDPILRSSNLWNKNGVHYTYGKNMTIANNTFTLKINPEDEFPIEAKVNYWNFVKDEGEVVLGKAIVSVNNKNSNQLQSCITVNDSDKNISYGYAARDVSEFPQVNDSTAIIFTDYFIGTNHNKTSKNSELKVYLWNRGKEEYKLIGFQVDVIDYWHQKWHFWD